MRPVLATALASPPPSPYDSEQMYVVGTAGHVDHGKSTLVHALTGIDPDRLREEKERGLTIDLGFAWLTLPSGREVSIVDVPGHERFIKNMLAGAGGVDLALLVVAADEGPMPQTREHLAILDLLDIPAGVVVITKCDLAEPDFVDLLEAEMQEVVAGSRLDGAPVVRVSAATGTGLEDLLATVDRMLERTPPRRDLGRARLPIDRAFTVQGFGVVVTGTLVDGALDVGQEVDLQPGRLTARVRGLQRHKTKVARLEPGTRAAVNLSGIRTEDVARGMVLAAPGSVVPARAVDVRLRGTSTLQHPLAHDAGVTFLSATAESEAKLRLLDRDALLPGEPAWAQLVLDSPVAVSRGDHCVVRTANETAGGGMIVAVNPRRHRRHHAPTLEALARQLEGSPADRLLDALLAHPMTAQEAQSALALPAAVVGAAAAELASGDMAREFEGRLYARTWLDSAAARAADAATTYCAANRLRAGAPREHVRSAARIDARDFEAVIGHATGGRRLEPRGTLLAPPAHKPALPPAQQREADAFLAVIRAGRYSPPTDHLPPPAVLAFLAEQGLVRDTGAGVVFDATVFDEMVASVRNAAGESGQITLAGARDLFGTSRKYAQAFLEYLDALHITRRTGDIHHLRPAGEAAR